MMVVVVGVVGLDGWVQWQWGVNVSVSVSVSGSVIGCGSRFG
jgi:hypothetical protein